MEYNGIKLRHEKKYYISKATKELLGINLESIIKVDENADDQKTYTVTSLYFDNMKDSSYYSKLSGIRDREKYRIRIYNNNSSKIMLEKKVKYGEYIGKVNCLLSVAQYNAIYTGQNIEILLEPKNDLLTEIFYKIRTERLAPRVVVEYDREAYISNFGNVRITFDKKLRAGLHDLDILHKKQNYITAEQGEKVIMEVKYDSYLPTIIRNLLSIAGKEHLSISKYVICVDIDNIYGGNFHNGKNTIVPRHI